MGSKFFGIRFQIDFKQNDWRKQGFVQKLIEHLNQIQANLDHQSCLKVETISLLLVDFMVNNLEMANRYSHSAVRIIRELGTHQVNYQRRFGLKKEKICD